MAVTFVAASATVTGANPTVAVPTGYAQGDLLLIITTGTATPTTPAGWTQRSAQGGTGFITILSKFATGSEASVAITLAGTTSSAVMLAYRGASGIDTISGFTTATAATSLAPGQTGNAFANELEITIYAGNNVAGTWGAAPSPTTSRVSSNPTASVNGLLIVDETQAAAGNSTARTGTINTAHTLSAVAIAVIPSGRYWVGGTGTWSTATTNWSFTSGGASGAPAPTAVDNVFFDQSATYTVTLTGALTCFDMTVSAGAVTFTSTGTPTVSGSMSLISGTVWSGTGLLTFNSTSTGRTITTSGTTINGSITFNGVGGAWSLGSALTTGVTLTTTLTNGSLSLNGCDLTTGIFSSNNTNTRVITFGGTIITTGSASFNGTNQYLSLANNSAFDFSTGDFTVEFWVNCTTPFTSMSNPGFLGKKSGDGSNGWQIYRNTTVNTTVMNIRIIGTNDYPATSGPATGVWEHWAVVRISGTLTWYRNGVPAGSYSGVTGNISDTAPLNIGFTQTWSGYFGSGYISNARVVKGVGVYTGTFTVPTAPLTATQSSGTNISAITGTQTSLLLNTTFGSNFLTDSSTFNNTVTNNNSVVSSLTNPFYGLINLVHTTAATTVLDMATVTGLTSSGTGGFTADASVTRTYTFGTTGGSTSNAPNLTLTGSGTAVGTFTTGSWFNTLNFGTTAFNPGTTALNIASSLTLSSGGTFTGLTATMLGTGTITPNTNTTLGALTINSTSGTTSLAANLTLTATGTTTLTSGTLALSGFNLTTGIFSSSVATTRAITFGSNNIVLAHTTAAQTVLNMATATGFTYTGTGGFTSDASVTRTYVFGTTGGTSTNAPNLSITSGAAVPTFTTGSWFNTLDFTGSSTTPAASVVNVNSINLSTGGTYTSLGVTTVGAGTITPNGKTIAAFTVNNGAGTTTLAGALGVTTYTQTAGTINFATFNLTCSSTASYTAGTLNNIGTISCTTWTITGTFTFSQGTITPSTSFVLSSGSFTYNSGATLSAVPTFTHTAGTVTLNQAYALTATGTYTLVAGTLTLGANLTTGIFSSSGTGVRSIAFSTFSIVLAHTTPATTVLAMSNQSSFTTTGTGGFSSDASITRTFTAGVSGAAAGQVVRLTFTGSGTAAQTITTASSLEFVDFGTTAFTLPTTSLFLNGFTLSPGGTFTGLSVTTSSTTGQTVTTNNRPIAAFQNGFSTLQYAITTLVGNLTCTTFVNNTLSTMNFGGYNVSCSSTFTHTGTDITNLGTITCTTFTINGPTFTFTSGTITPSTSFVLTAGTFNYSGGTLSAVPTFTHTAGSVTLNQAYALTTAGTYTLVAGTLTLNSNLTTGAFITTGTGTRAIAFGTSQITLTGNNTTIWDGGGVGISYTGTPTIVSNYTGSVGTRTINVGTAWTESTDFDVKVGSAVGISIGSSGTDTVAIAGVMGSLDLTGMLFTFSPGVMTVYGSYTIPATGGSVSASASLTTFGSTQVTPVVITVSRSVDFPITFSGVGGTFNLGANFTTGTTRTTTLTSGTLALNGYNYSTGLFSSAGALARTISFGTNTITSSGSGTVWDTGTITNLTITGTPVVNVTNATATATTVNSGALPESTAISFNFTAGTYALTFLGTAGYTAGSVNYTGFAGTLNAIQNCTIYGSYTLSTGMTVTNSSNSIMTFAATNGTITITSNGKSMPRIIINGVGGTFNLGSDLNISGGSASDLNISGGTFNTNNYNISGVNGFNSYTNIVNTRVINLGSSTITSLNSNTTFRFDTTNLTFNAGTSTIVFTHNILNNLIVNTGNLTLYNVIFNSVTTNGTHTISGSITFNNLTGPTSNSARNSNFIITNNIVVNGTFTMPAATATNNSCLVKSATLGSQVTITAAAVSLSTCNFRDINAQGASISWTGTRLGDLGNNTNITFAAGKTVYWNLAAGGNWDSVAWALTSGGTPSATNYPLPQDSCVIENTGLNTNAIINLNNAFITTLDMSTRTNAFSLNFPNGSSISITGDWINGSGTSITKDVSGFGINFINNLSGTQNITSAGKLFVVPISVATTGTVRLLDNFDQDSTGSQPAFEFTQGTLNLNNFNLSTATFNSENSNTRAINFGTGYINLTNTTAATTVLAVSNASNFTASGTGGFRATMSVTRTFNFGNSNAPIVPPNLFINSGASIPTITTGNYFNLLDFTGSTCTPAVTTLNLYNLTLATGGTYTNLTATMVSSGTITGNSKTLAAVTISGGTTTISGTLTSTGAFTVNGGTFTHSSGAILNAATFTLTTGTVNLNGGTLPTTATFGHTAGTLNVNSTTSLTATSTYTFTAGTLNLVNGTVLNVGIFSSNNSNTRTIAFGTTSSGNINLTHTTAATTVLSMATLTGFTYTGLGGFTVATMTNTRTFTCGTTAGGTSTNAPNLTFTTGASVATITTAGWFNKLDYGTTSFTQAASTLNVNSITLSTTGTYTALILNLVGSGTLTYNGKTTAAVTLLAGTPTFADTITCTTFTVNGPDFAFSSGTLNPSTSFVVTSGSFTYSGTATLGAVPTFTQTAGNVTFSKSYALTVTGTYTHTAGNLTLGSSVILSTGIFSSNNANTRSIAFGAAILSPSGSIFFNGTTQYLSRTGTTGDGLDLATGASDWTVECWFQPTGAAATGAIFWKGGTTGSVNPSYALFLSAGTGQWIVGDGAGGGYVQNISSTFLVNTWYHFALVRNGSTLTAYINGIAQTPLTITTAIGNTTNNTLTIGSSVADGSTRFLAGYISNFRIVKGTAVYTSNFTPSTVPLGSLQAANVCGSPSAAITDSTQTSLLLNTVFGQKYTQDSSSYALAITNVASSVSRTLTPWSGSINLTHTTAATVVLSMATLTGISYTGTGGFTVADMGVTRTFTVGTTAGGSTTTAPSLAFTTGASIPTITTGGWYDNLEFGAISSTLAATAQSVAGSLNLSPAGTYTALTPSLVSTDTGLLFSNGKTVAALIINGTGGTFSFIDATAITGALTLTAGSVIAYGNISSATFASTGTVTRSLTGPGITYTVSGAGATAFSNASGTGMSMTNIIISMTNAAAKTFAGGGGSYPTLNQGGAGALTISGSNSFENITNTTRPATVTFTSGTTQTFQNFSLAGIAGSLLTINASTAASAATLSKASGPVYGSYLSIQDSTATGGATWYAGPTSTNVSNNTGWIFSQLNIVTLGNCSVTTGGLTISDAPLIFE